MSNRKKMKNLISLMLAFSFLAVLFPVLAEESEGNEETVEIRDAERPDEDSEETDDEGAYALASIPDEAEFWINPEYEGLSAETPPEEASGYEALSASGREIRESEEAAAAFIRDQMIERTAEFTVSVHFPNEGEISSAEMRKRIWNLWK